VSLNDHIQEHGQTVDQGIDLKKSSSDEWIIYIGIWITRGG
jgi:hypothetical protein